MPLSPEALILGHRPAGPGGMDLRLYLIGQLLAGKADYAATLNPETCERDIGLIVETAFATAAEVLERLAAEYRGER